MRDRGMILLFVKLVHEINEWAVKSLNVHQRVELLEILNRYMRQVLDKGKLEHDILAQNALRSIFGGEKKAKG